MTDTFDLIATQRRVVADVLETLTGDEWSSDTLCEGWRVQEMAAHLTMPFRVSNPKFFLGVIGAGGSIAKVMDRFAHSHSGEPPEQLIATLRDNAGSHFVPPTFPPVASLTEIVVHGFDISIPTHRHVEMPEEVSRLVLDYLVSKKPGSVYTKRGLASDVRLTSTDSTWSWGMGPEVAGSNFGLIMMLARRPVGFDHVSGEGVDLIRRHLAMS
jgi:uncharacterized protein (TIGR03083 family)